MAVAQTLKEIALEKAKKRPELVDYLTEEAPILTLLKWIPATHGLWNVEEVLDKITGASFTDLGAPLPTMQAETQLRQTYVSLMGGEIEVSKDKAAQFGGAKQYFARRENAFYRQAGMDTELAIWRDYWRKAALKDRLFTSCGGTGSTLSSILVVRFDQEINVGIYDPTQFNSGRLLDPTPINAKLVENYYHQIKDIAAQTGIPEPQDWFYTLLRMPDVETRIDTVVLTDEEWEIARKTIEEAVQALTDFRKQEGEALERKFNEKVDNIEALLHSIEPYEQQRVPKIKEKILEGLKQIPEVEYDKNRLEQELIYYIEKLDISEEKQRLTNHLKYFRETMRETGHGVGKKLGFIAQEMGREINTTGSKSNQAEMQNIVVRMKDELEQIKEQVLNAL